MQIYANYRSDPFVFRSHDITLEVDVNPWKDLLDNSDGGLHQGVDEGTKGFVGVQRPQDPTPQIQAVNVLPVVHRLVGIL